MAFVDKFYLFTFEIALADSGVFTKVRTKVPRYPYESTVEFYGKIVAYCLSFEKGLTFVKDSFTSEKPTLAKYEGTGECSKWVDVGIIEKKKLQKALREHSNAKFELYFLHSEEAQNLASELRGSRSNWIEGVKAWQLDSEQLKELEKYDLSSPTWHMTLVDHEIYLEVNNHNVYLTAKSVDLWDLFQHMIHNHPNS